MEPPDSPPSSAPVDSVVVVLEAAVVVFGASVLEVPRMLRHVFALSVALAATWAFGKARRRPIPGAVQNDGSSRGES